MSEPLDLRGLKCPLPALFARRALARLAPGEEIEVMADDPLAAVDIPHMCHQEGHVVVMPSSGAAGPGGDQGSRHEVGKRSVERGFVHIRDETTEGLGHVGPGHAGQDAQLVSKSRHLACIAEASGQGDSTRKQIHRLFAQIQRRALTQKSM